MSDKPPPFANYLPVSTEDIWKKILSGGVAAHIYSSEAKGNFEPVPITTAEFFLADQAGCDQEYGFSTGLGPFQILWRDVDRRRSNAARRGTRIPHWVYVMKAAAPTPKKERTGPGAAEQYDWDDIEQFVRQEFTKRGDFKKPENRVKGWRSQNNLIEAVKDYLQRKKPPESVPGPTQLKAKVADMLKRIRSELPTDH
jgi:hypothetical protein